MSYPQMSEELKKLVAAYNAEVNEWRKKHPLTVTSEMTNRHVVTRTYRDGKLVESRSVERRRSRPFKGKWMIEYDPDTQKLFMEKIS